MTREATADCEFCGDKNEVLIRGTLFRTGHMLDREASSFSLSLPLSRPEDDIKMETFIEVLHGLALNLLNLLTPTDSNSVMRSTHGQVVHMRCLGLPAQ